MIIKSDRVEFQGSETSIPEYTRQEVNDRLSDEIPLRNVYNIEDAQAFVKKLEKQNWNEDRSNFKTSGTCENGMTWAVGMEDTFQGTKVFLIVGLPEDTGLDVPSNFLA